jgi:thiol-disulfide isomerase/thioredoxin
MAIAAFLFSAALQLCASDDFVRAAPKTGEPTDLKARKTFATAMDWEKLGAFDPAIGDYRKANKLDGGKCHLCLTRAYSLAFNLGAFKVASEIAQESLAAATNDTERSAIHLKLGRCLLEEGTRKRKNADLFNHSAQEFKTALQLAPEQSAAHFFLGMALANLLQDDAARVEFQAFLDEDRRSPNLHARAERLVERVDLARARMAPPFTVTTLDGQRVSLDGLAGKVLLIDFWATWCPPCREALPRIRSIAKKFEGQPLVVLSVSLDSDDETWRAFVEKNAMNWLQTRDGTFGGHTAQIFGVNAIPATVTIDADGVLEDQHVGDANIEGKLKKLVAQAAQAKPAS